MSQVSAAECERFVADMLAHMTLLEKVGQLAFRAAPDPSDQDATETFARALRAGRIGGVRAIGSREEAERWQQVAQEQTRLGIPLLFSSDVQTGFDTVFPTPATMCASFDASAVEHAGKVIAQEAEGHGVNWLIGPKLTIGSSVAAESETFQAEHPQLAALLASAQVRGLQDRSDTTHPPLLACLDLIADRGPAERIAMQARAAAWEAISSAQVGAITFHRTIDEARRQLEETFSNLTRRGLYDGIVLSDWDSLASAATGSGSEFQHDTMPVDSLVEAVSAGAIPTTRLDDAVARVLRAKFRLGLFAKELSGSSTVRRGGLPTPVQNREVALGVARRAAILLRNQPALLPLGIDSGEILVVGSAAGDRHLPLAGRKGVASSVIDGLEQLGIPHRYVPGLALRHDGTSHGRMIDADRMAIGMACEAAKRAGTLIVVLGAGKSGALGEAQRQLLTSLSGANPRIVLVTLGAKAVDPVVGGAPLPAVIHAGELGAMSGHAIAELLTGEASPSGKLPYELKPESDAPGLPFGHGETYADFALTGAAFQIAPSGIVVSAELRNVSEREGSEAIQLYVTRRSNVQADDGAMQLIALSRHHLRPGERTGVSFQLGREEIGIEQGFGQFRVDAGEYEFFLGVSQTRGTAETVFIDEELAAAMTRGGKSGGSHPLASGRRRA